MVMWLTGNGNVFHRECTSLPGMHILTGNPHSLCRMIILGRPSAILLTRWSIPNTLKGNITFNTELRLVWQDCDLCCTIKNDGQNCCCRCHIFTAAEWNLGDLLVWHSGSIACIGYYSCRLRAFDDFAKVLGHHSWISWLGLSVSFSDQNDGLARPEWRNTLALKYWWALCCVCESDIETLDHFLFNCPAFRQNFEMRWYSLNDRIKNCNPPNTDSMIPFILNPDKGSYCLGVFPSPSILQSSCKGEYENSKILIDLLLMF